MPNQTQNGSAQRDPQDDLRVTISAAGRADLDSGSGIVIPKLIHAITVSQPIQSWTVIRDHVDFITLGSALSTVIAGIPQCPPLPSFAQHGSASSSNPASSNTTASSDSNHQMAEILQVRTAAQIWLTTVLLFPGARESPAVRQFLCYGANSVPAQYQGINWITASDEVVDSSTSAHQQRRSDNHSSDAGRNADPTSSHSVDELEMDDMFGYDDVQADDDEEDDDYDDDAEFFSATERYQPTIEAVSKDDMMEFQNNADDVEMIEDVGSLAQSMGASHLGRSLQLQAEMSGLRKHPEAQAQANTSASAGLNIGSGSKFSDASHSVISPLGGIGNAVEKAGIQQEAAVDGLSDSFYQKSPISAPRLDSFKMIKVVGKGSFGKLTREITADASVWSHECYTTNQTRPSFFHIICR